MTTQENGNRTEVLILGSNEFGIPFGYSLLKHKVRANFTFFANGMTLDEKVKLPSKTGEVSVSRSQVQAEQSVPVELVETPEKKKRKRFFSFTAASHKSSKHKPSKAVDDTLPVTVVQDSRPSSPKEVGDEELLQPTDPEELPADSSLLQGGSVQGSITFCDSRSKLAKVVAVKQHYHMVFFACSSAYLSSDEGQELMAFVANHMQPSGVWLHMSNCPDLNLFKTAAKGRIELAYAVPLFSLSRQSTGVTINPYYEGRSLVYIGTEHETTQVPKQIKSFLGLCDGLGVYFDNGPSLCDSSTSLLDRKLCHTLFGLRKDYRRSHWLLPLLLAVDYCAWEATVASKSQSVDDEDKKMEKQGLIEGVFNAFVQLQQLSPPSRLYKMYLPGLNEMDRLLHIVEEQAFPAGISTDRESLEKRIHRLQSDLTYQITKLDNGADHVRALLKKTELKEKLRTSSIWSK